MCWNCELTRRTEVVEDEAHSAPQDCVVWTVSADLIPHPRKSQPFEEVVVKRQIGVT